MFSRKKRQQEEPTDEAIDDEENEESYVDEPVEIDEEGQVGREPEIVVDDNDGGIDDDNINGDDNVNGDIINGDMNNNNDDDDDTRDVNVPPATTEDATEYDDDGAPPPPPPPLDDYDGERVLDEQDLDERDLDDDDYGNVGNDDDYDDDVPQRNPSRKKKLAIAAVGLAMVASLGIGLGVGLGNGSSKDAASESNAGSSGASGLDEVAAAGADADGVDDVDVNVNGEEVDLKGGEEDALTETDSAAEMPASNGEEMEDEEASEDFDYDDDDDDYDAATTTVATETPVVESEDQGRDEVTTATTEATQPSLAEEDDGTEDYVEYDDNDGGTTAAADANETETVAAEEPEVLPMVLQSEYDAVIIGAGWAGIRALETFLNNGVESVLVLEAANYVGGRSKSVNFQNDNDDDDDDSISINDASKVGDETNVPYDVGGGWLYGEGSAQDDVLMEMGFLDPVLGNDMYTAVPLQTGVFYQQARDEDSGELTAEVLEDGEDWMEEIWGGFLQWRGDRGDDLEGESYADAIDQYWDDWGWTDDESLQFLNLVEDVMETEYTAESSQLGVREVNFFPPGYTIMSHYTGVPGMGFGNVAAEYAKPFEDRISLNSKVTEINSVPFMDGSGDTVVKYERNGEVGEVAAKTVLVTASLGVLKAGNIDFVPTIPGWKQEVIDEMGFGTTNKCIMTWDDDDALVWPADKLWFLLMTPEDETSGLWTQFYNPSKFKGKPSLVSWVGGDEVVEEERKSDEEILERVMTNLRSMFPDIRDPDNVVVSRWGQEENVRGSYTFPVPGRDINSDARDLSRRIAKIWFAGEATGNGWGTTNGAWKTGEDQALRMVEDLQEDV